MASPKGVEVPSDTKENAEGGRFRLTESQLQALREVVRHEEESRAGLKTKYIVDMPANGAGPARRLEGEIYILDAEAWCDMNGINPKPANDDALDMLSANKHLRGPWERRARARNALRTLLTLSGGHQHVGVLVAVYGPGTPTHHRLRSESWRSRQVTVQKMNPDSEATLYSAPSRADRGDNLIARELLDRLGDDLYPLARYTDAVEDARQQMITAEAEASAPNRAELAVYVRAADRRLTSMDAIREAMAPTGSRQPDESPERYRLRVQQRKAERDVFLSRVKVDANRLLTEASRAYYDVWRRS